MEEIITGERGGGNQDIHCPKPPTCSGYVAVQSRYWCNRDYTGVLVQSRLHWCNRNLYL